MKSIFAEVFYSLVRETSCRHVQNELYLKTHVKNYELKFVALADCSTTAVKKRVQLVKYKIVTHVSLDPQ